MYELGKDIKNQQQSAPASAQYCADKSGKNILTMFSTPLTPFGLSSTDSMVPSSVYTTSGRVDSATSYCSSTAVCHARGLAVAHSIPLGGSTSPRLCVRKLTLKICDFVDITSPLCAEAHAQDLRFRRHHLASVCGSSR
jgi:hypothetical protein